MSRSSIFSFDTVRGLRPRLDPALLVAVAAVVAAELVLRVGGIEAGPPRQGYFPPPHVFDSTCGYRYEPDYRGRFVGPDYDADLAINSHGFHAPEFARPKPADAYRVAILGDSFLAAISVDAAATWTARLPAHLAPVGGRKVEVLNFGVDGYLPWNMARLLESEVLSFSPDAVVLWVDPQRLRNARLRYRSSTTHGTILEGCDREAILKETELENRRARPLSEILADHSRLARGLGALFGKIPAPNIRPAAAPAATETAIVTLPGRCPEEAAFARMVEVCREAGIPFGVVYRERRPRPDEDLAAEFGVPSSCDAEQVGSYAALRWPHDPHFSVEGNARYARLAAPVFDRLLADLSSTQLTSNRQ